MAYLSMQVIVAIFKHYTLRPAVVHVNIRVNIDIKTPGKDHSLSLCRYVHAAMLFKVHLTPKNVFAKIL